ncbi:MAG TPA: sigma-70 family RNA polymerase sigma factor [Jiangellaceae bacterium]
MKVSDESLLAGMAAGDVGAAATFVRRFQARVYGLALAVVGIAPDAEEVAQEAFMRAWRHAGNFDPRRGRVSTWLLTITRNVAIDKLRVRRDLSGIAWQATTDDRELAAGYRETLDVADGQYFAAAPITGDGGVEVGHVFLYDGDPSWVLAVLGPAAAPGAYDVVVRTGDGVNTIATCVVETTGCGGGATTDARISAIEDVRLVGPGGTSFTADLTSRRSAK